MSPDDFCKMLKRVGCRGEKQTTGNPEWSRVFIQYKGCTYGRASFLRGELNTIKFYYSSNKFCFFQLWSLMQFDYLPCIEEYNHAMHFAMKEANYRHNLKLAARRRLSPKKRRALAPPNPERWLHKIFEYKYIIFRGCV